MAIPVTLRRSAGGSTVRGGHTLRGAGGVAAIVITHVAHIVAFRPARAGRPGSVEKP